MPPPPHLHKPNATIIFILEDLSNDIWHAYQSWKLVGDEENNIPPPLH